MIDFSLVFNLTLTQFNLTAKSLAEKAKMDQNVVSGFRNRKFNTQVATMERLLEVMPIEAKTYFVSLLNQQITSGSITLTQTYEAPPRKQSAHKRGPKPRKNKNNQEEGGKEEK